MNSFTNTILTLLLGWLRTLLNAARTFVASDSSTVFFDFFRNNWKVIFIILCVGGFVLDKIVYLIRWRPSPIWIRIRARHQKHSVQPPQAYAPPEPAYDESAFFRTAPPIPDEEYPLAVNQPAAEAAPTMQYHMQLQAAPMDTRRVQPDFTLPYDPSESAQNPYSDPIAPLYTDDPMQDQSFAPASNQQTFAFGMAPSFGSAQSEPAYGYYRDATPSFAPPQFSQDLPPAPSYAPQPEAQSMPQYEPDTLLNYQPDAMPEDDREPNPYFRPFSDRGEDTFAPPRSHRFGSVARKARSFLNADEESQAVSYQDLQQTVDVSKAFHSPVYPKKKPEGD